MPDKKIQKCGGNAAVQLRAARGSALYFRTTLPALRTLSSGEHEALTHIVVNLHCEACYLFDYLLCRYEKDEEIELYLTSDCYYC